MTLECPYCDYEMDDPDGCYEEEKTYEQECGSCGKRFVFTVSYSRDYRPKVAECLNGGSHEWKRTSANPYSPKYAVMRCTICDDERPLTEDDK